MSLHVLDAGLYTLVVDLGRPHCRSLGVPVGGAADRTSLILGNALVGNPPDAAGLEFSLTGPTLRAACDLACVVYGAPFQLASDLQKLIVGKTFTLRAGEVLQVQGTPLGVRGYLCVRGGLQMPVILGSRSGLGPVRAGAVLPCLPGTIRARFFRSGLGFWPLQEIASKGLPTQLRLHALAGAQIDWFSKSVFKSSYKTGHSIPRWFRVSAASNRMGLRLEGEPLPVPDRELVSEPVCPGAVQVTRDGQCIILGVDGQTIGGYPKAAQIISAELDMVGQLRPGDELALILVDLEFAEHFAREKAAHLATRVTRLRAAAGAW